MAADLKSDGTTSGVIVQQDKRAEACVERCLKQFSQLQTWRNVTAGQWEEIAEIVDPNSRNTFFFGNYNFPGQKKTERQIDSNGMLALEKFKAICDSLLTPRNMFWHSIGIDDATAEYLKKNRSVKLYYEQATKALFTQRYAATANFASQNQGVFHSLGAYGTGGMFTDALFSHIGDRGLRYRAPPIGELFIKENHQGQINEFIRWFRLTAEQAYQQFKGVIPPQLETARQQGSQQKYNFLHWVCENEEYQEGKLDHRQFPYSSYYIAYDGKMLLEEGGYRTFPLAISRYIQAPNEVYGRGPAGLVLPTLKTLNAEKRVFLKQGHRAGDPVLLTADDGLQDFNLIPGAQNKGYMVDGKPQVGVLPSGEIQITEKMMDAELMIIKDAFLVLLFQIMTETPSMTATEVIERVNEKGILLAPTMGRQQSEYLGTLIPRELDVMAQLRLLPKMPPILQEARTLPFKINYHSPISRAMRAQEAAGFVRTVETVKELVNITGDASLLDPFNFDVAIPEIAEIQAVPASWMADAAMIAQKRENRGKAQEKQQAIQALPAQAAMLKAQNTVNKNQPGIAPGQAFGGPMGPMPRAGAGQMGNG